MAASPLPFGENWHTPREVTEDDMERVREAFVSAAKRALRIGFDEIELHMAHGYLAHGFMSPVSNKRTDQYGGTFENRLRFPLSIARAVRAVVPKDIPLGARITGSDWRPDGLTPDDAVAIAKALEGRRHRLHLHLVRRRHRRHPQPDRRPATTCRSPRA